MFLSSGCFICSHSYKSPKKGWFLCSVPDVRMVACTQRSKYKTTNVQGMVGL